MTGPRAPLSVRINDGVTDRHVTSAVRGLSFRKTAPGGYTAASMKILLPRNTFPSLGPADKVYIYDGRTGRTVWEGFTENPGKMDGPGGQGFDLSCLGTTILASDQSRGLMYVDQDLSRWVSLRVNAAGIGVSQSEDPTTGTGNGMLCQFNSGIPITTNSEVRIVYRAMQDAGMEVGAVQVSTHSGKTDANYVRELTYAPGPGSSSIGTMSTTPGSAGRFTDTAGHFPAGTTQIGWRLRRTGGATNIADDTTYEWFNSIYIAGRRMNRFGTLASGVADMVTPTYVLASWVVEDLLGRVLTFADKGLSQVGTTTFQIDQLAYPDGVKASQLLDDLSLWEPGFLWEMLESTPNGYRFNYRAWPTDARYEISVADGYNSPGADTDLCNRIAVFWTDPRGNPQTTVLTANVPELGGDPAAGGFTGRIRDADPITLPDGKGSAANATQIGTQILAAKANPPAAATAVLDRPILDRLTGNTVFPWEIEAGYPVRVRETGDVLRLTELQYDDDSCSTTLTLGTPQLTNEQRLAQLSAKVA